MDGKVLIELNELRTKVAEFEKKSSEINDLLPDSLQIDLGVVEQVFNKINLKREKPISFFGVADLFFKLQIGQSTIDGKAVSAIKKSEIFPEKIGLGKLEFDALIVALIHEEFILSERNDDFAVIYVMSNEFRKAARYAALADFLIK